ncbi:M20 aminoacylase family protein [Pseudosulfitobacter pseudonitzschiae]|uniref:M20 aminoacylase family protein n=1 Tax=Pseudosulfitobacter pseudonitzschiae TaxID=1402135 RepID=UPI001AF5D945|nr:M20 aminoacylase family protein [Pseudosulfitobacter pseudonitzschiae]MBM1817959.1 amidohydrolase [Pseudosulfitobacter pseudonitzschiae]MBM1835017.1 amidohydrolase [Pseudosulfitobacter pseudonitzschiae]MBM1839818.1 amidohydrolase [Pseudosulfitobacter pseudonitzschiae]MBM1844732.1 amidohydrolase [Pseudosulfitobacter pseudonitzschiae]MBM1849503.1 amidohydrolase [Pseudosulfitobacter pseudonitzschiae]
MSVIPKIEAFAAELTEIRRDFHAHPELGFEETRTAAIVAEKLRAYGVDEVHEGLGGTGVVGLIKGQGGGNRRVGLRADMDALPIEEASGVAYSSTNPGRMHACGHDGHTTMLLGAARYLAETRDFDGTVVLIFQPAEEGLGGARRMIEEGLFEKFPCDEIYGMHNDPNSEPGVVSVTPGPAMAGASFFDITITGTGSHAAMPHQSKDPIVIGTALIQQLQSVVSRNTPPTKPLVLSVTKFNSGSAYNVVPGAATIAGTIRYFHDDVIEMAESRMRELCEGMALAYGVKIDVDLRNVFDVLMNDPDLSTAYVAAAAGVVGADMASEGTEQATGSEDFADMLKVVPGAYCRVGHAGSIPLHNPAFVLDDAILPVGASIYARIVETRLPKA